MLNIKVIQCNMLAENCYIVNNDNNECIIIDCGAYGEVEYSYIKQYISENNLTPKMHLLTHGHFDHIMGAKWEYETYEVIKREIFPLISVSVSSDMILASEEM